MKTWENLVIGSGPGGAVTALTLNELGQEVLVLESGKRFVPDEKRAFTIDDMTEKYKNGGVTAAFGRPKIAYVEGSLFGGGSEVNAGLYHRTPTEVLAEWEKDFDCKGLTTQELEKYFSYCENILNVSLDPVSPKASLKLAEGATALGWKSKQVPRWIKDGHRQSMSTSVLSRLQGNSFEIKTNIFVQSIHKSGSSWQVITENETFQCQNLYVCAGAISTPSLLLRSGIRKNIGRSLQMHPSFKFVAEFSEDINAKEMGVPFHQVNEFYPAMSFGCSISTPPYLAVALIDHLQEFATLSQQWKKMAIYYSMIRPKTRGRIVNLPLQKEPLVLFPLCKKDLQSLETSVQSLAKILFAAGAKRLYPCAANSAPLKNLDEVKQFNWKKIQSDARLMTVHVFSSCPMGENKKRTATDSFGRVWNQENLYINDASLLCSAPGVNPQGTVMAMARRNVLHHQGKN